MGPLVAGNTYLIALSSNGDDGGDFEFEIKFNLGPPNDDPCADLSAYDITGSGSITSTTNCAGDPLPFLPDSPLAIRKMSFYQFTIPAVGVRGVHIVNYPSGANPLYRRYCCRCSSRMPVVMELLLMPSVAVVHWTMSLIVYLRRLFPAGFNSWCYCRRFKGWLFWNCRCRSFQWWLWQAGCN